MVKQYGVDVDNIEISNIFLLAFYIVGPLVGIALILVIVSGVLQAFFHLDEGSFVYIIKLSLVVGYFWFLGPYFSSEFLRFVGMLWSLE